MNPFNHLISINATEMTGIFMIIGGFSDSSRKNEMIRLNENEYKIKLNYKIK